MTEAEWLTATDPTPMLEFLRHKVSDRKLRLFAAMCCRRAWADTNDEQFREILLLVEGFADGIIKDRERGRANQLSLTLARSKPHESQRRLGWELWKASSKTLDRVYLSYGGSAAESFGYRAGDGFFNAAKAAERKQQAVFLRDIFGNPFRPIVVEPEWLTSTVLALATGIYQDRAFDRMPILADALMDAGCDNDDILSHCRQEGEHVRGCWVVDLLLGKA